MNKIIKYIFIVFIYIYTGCGGSESVLKNGVFLDSAYVSGLRYKCGDISGHTDEKGLFVFRGTTKTCEFYLGANKLIATLPMLEDRIITPFEVTTSTASALQLSTIIQSLSVPQNGVLLLDKDKASKLGLVDLTNPIQTSSNILAVSSYVKPLSEVKQSLSKHYDIQSGSILTQAQKDAKNTIPTTPTNPITPTTPTKPPCIGDACTAPPPPTTKPPLTNCPVGAKCLNTQIPESEDEVCFPGSKDCKIPQNTTPCFPGSDCDESNPDTSTCLPGQSGSICGNNNITQVKQCLPGKTCTSVISSDSCLPGAECQSNTNNFPTPSTTPSPQPPTDTDICLPGDTSCSKNVNTSSNQNTQQNPTVQPSTNNNIPIPTTSPNAQCTPLPGKAC